MSPYLTALLCPLVQPVSCNCGSKVGVREYVMWNIMRGSKIMANMCTYENVLCRLGRERGGVSVEVLDLYTLSRKYIMGSPIHSSMH